MLRLLIVFLLLLAIPAHAQTAGSAAGAPAISAAQAQAVLGVLKDDRKRAEFTNTLEALVRAAPAAAPAEPAPPAPALAPAPAPGAPAAGTPAAPATPAVALPLAPDSLGAQLIDQVARGLTDAGHQISTTVASVNDLPTLQRWIVTQATDPVARSRMLDAAWKLLVVMALGVGADTLVQRLLRPLERRLAAGVPSAEVDAEQADADKLAEDAPVQDAAEADATALRARHNRLHRAFRLMQRLPRVVGRLLLELVPVAAFFAVAYVALGTRLGEPATTRLVINAVVSAYAAARIVLCLMRMLVAPGFARLRLLNVTDWMADFVARWTRRITVVAVSGNAVAQIGLLFGMYRAAYDSLLKLVGLLVHLGLVVAVLQCRGPVARHLRAPKRASGLVAGLRNRFAQIWHIVAIFYIVALWVVWALELPDGYRRLLHFFVVTTAVAFVGRLVAIIALGTADRLLRVAPEAVHRYPGLEDRLGFYHPLMRHLLSIVITAASGFAMLVLWGFHPQNWFATGQLGGRVVSAVLAIALTTALAVAVWEGANFGVERHLARLTRSAQLARSARLRTLLPMLRTALFVVILLIVALMVLSEIGVNIAPLLAGAGVVGIAVGFGSQKLVQDLITGLFLLLENAMQVGDVVTLGGLSGTVEALSIRTIRLRALDGSVHIIPFSAVTTVTNQTRDFSYALIDVSVGLNEEPSQVSPILRDVARAMREDPAWRDILQDDLDVMGVEKFIDTAWVLRARIKTLPASRWAVARELNRRVKMAFDELAIESPITSHRVLSNNPPPPADASIGAPAPINPRPQEQVA